MSRLLAVVLGILVSTSSARAQAGTDDRVGDLYEIVLTQTTETSGEGSSGSSSSSMARTERVVAVGDDGLELEFDLPAETSEADRMRTWQYPVRVLKRADGSLALLNEPELRLRIDAWLARAGLGRETCGAWYFTWNAFKVECEPQSVLKDIAVFDLRRSDLRDGVEFHQPGAQAPVPLRLKSSSSIGATFVAEMQIDADSTRKTLAETDVIISSMLPGGKPVTLEAAMAARQATQVSGTITTTIEVDPAARIVRRTEVSRSEIIKDGKQEVTNATTNVTRKLVSGAQR